MCINKFVLLYGGCSWFAPLCTLSSILVLCNKKYSECALHVSFYYVVLCNKMVYFKYTKKKLLLNPDSITTKKWKKKKHKAGAKHSQHKSKLQQHNSPERFLMFFQMKYFSFKTNPYAQILMKIGQPKNFSCKVRPIHGNQR